MLLEIQPILSGETDSILFDYPLLFESCENDSGLADITFPVPFQVHGSVINMAGYMRLSVETVITYHTHCARCLEEITRSLSLHFEKSVAVQNTLENEDNDDYILVSNGKLDIDTPLKEQIFMEFPYKHLCKEDCKGLCPKCGINWNTDECSCVQKEPDERWAALKKVLEK